jgi:putative transposase
MFCALFGFSKQAYFKQKQRQQTSLMERSRTKNLVMGFRRLMPKIGTRKLHYLLGADIRMGRDRLFELLRKEGMLIFKRRKYSQTTNSRHWLRKYPNLTKNLKLTRPEQLWVSDITYVDTTEEGNTYLHLVTDAYSKQIMGYELCGDMESASTLKALKMALGNRRYDHSLIHHSDRGLQYCSRIYVDELKRNGIMISMTENGDPYENATAERINGILKGEFGLGDVLNNLSEAKALAKQSIAIYNHLRPHLSCKMLTPVQMHAQQKIEIKTYKKTLNNC